MREITMALLFCYAAEMRMIATMTDGIDRSERLRVLKELTDEAEERKKGLEQGKRGPSVFKSRLYELRDIRSRCPVIEEMINNGDERPPTPPPEPAKPRRRLTATEKFYVKAQREEGRQRRTG